MLIQVFTLIHTARSHFPKFHNAAIADLPLWFTLLEVEVWILEFAIIVP